MFHKNEKKCVGILLSSRSLFAVEFLNEKDKPTLKNYSKINLEKNVVEGGCAIIDKEKFKAALKQLFDEGVNGPICTNQVFLALPEENTFSHQITIPREQLENVGYIKQVAKDYIPIELEEAIFDFKIVDVAESGKDIALNFFAIQGSLIDALIQSFEEAGIEILRLDIDISCFIRSFTNRLNYINRDFLLVHLDFEREILSAPLRSGKHYQSITQKNSKALLEKKTSLSIPSEYIKEFEKKLDRFLKIMNQEELAALKCIYLTGVLSTVSDVQKILNKYFPSLEIKTHIEYLEVADELENELLTGAGLCLNQNEMEWIDLLPPEKKEALNLAPYIPKLKKYFLLTVLFLGLITGEMGIIATKKYIDYQVKSHEVIILTEQTLNPYMIGIAKLKQEKKQRQNQILSVLDDAIPVSMLITSIDQYNHDGIKLLNITYDRGADPKISEIGLKAEITTRKATEELAEALGKNDFFKEVISPLSNLVGKETRFVRIDMHVDNQKVINAFNKQNKDAESL